MKSNYAILFIISIGLLVIGCKPHNIQSNNADLASLTIDSGVLSPAFDADTLLYTASVPWVVSSVFVTGTPDNSAAAVSSAITLSTLVVGVAQTASIMVTAVNGDTKTYSVAVTRAAPVAVSFSTLTADGSAGAITTTSLTLGFDADPTSLTAEDIIVTGATKGALTGTGLTRSLAVSAISVGNGQFVSVVLTSPEGFIITPVLKEVAVNVAPPAIAFTGATANGTLGSLTSTLVTLSFDTDPVSLAAEDITVTGATKGALTGTGLTRTLGIANSTVADGATISVAINNPGKFTMTPGTLQVAVYKYSIGLTMITVPAGSFLRDTLNSNLNISTVASFSMGQTEITRTQFLAIMGTDPTEIASSRGLTDPVMNITWYMAIAFCNKLSIAEGLSPVYSVSGVNFNTLTYTEVPTVDSTTWNAVVPNYSTNNGYRLPTEMEWEWAAMGATLDRSNGYTGTGLNTTGYSKAYAGSTELGSAKLNINTYVIYSLSSGPLDDANDPRQTRPVGSRAANELGLFEMSGNIAEWCFDAWDGIIAYPDGLLSSIYYSNNGSMRVRRGGTAFNHSRYCSIFRRTGDTPVTADYGSLLSSGIRVVRP